MNQLAFLEYTFMFDPSEAYTNLYQFEGDLVKFFAAKGLEAEIVKTVTGQQGRRILVIKKKPDIEMSREKNPIGRPPSIGTMIRKITPEKRVRAAERKFRDRAK